MKGYRTGTVGWYSHLCLLPCVAFSLLSLSLAAQLPVPVLHSRWITLGTNGGPLAKPTRSEPANLVVYGDQHVLVDCGDGAAEQIAKAGVPAAMINAVIISHLHFDHTGGLFGLMGMRYQTLTQTVLTIYGPPGIKRTVDALIAGMQPESESGRGIPGEPRRPPEDTVRVIEIRDGDQFRIGPMAITAKRNSHYSFPPDSEDAARYQSLSLRFDLPDRSIVYTGDTGFSKAVEELARGADLYVTEVGDPAEAMTEVRKRIQNLPPTVLEELEQHMREQHMSAEGVGEMAVVLTHNSFDLAAVQKAIATIHTVFPGKVIEAHDLDSF